MSGRKMRFPLSLLLVLGLMVIIPLCVFAQQPGGKPPKDAKGGKAAAGGPAAMMMMPQPVLVAKVGVAVPIVAREYRGTFEAIEKVRIIGRVSGRIMNVAFKEGDMVQKGEPLFEIEDTEYAANLRVAKAQVTSNEALIHEYEAKINEMNAKIRYAETNYERVKALYERGKASSEDDVDNALSTLESEKAQLEGAKAALIDAQGQLELAKGKVDLAEFNLSHTKIASPISGRTGRLAFTEGNYITPSDGSLVVIAQMDPIYIRFSISETDFVSLFGSADALRETAQLQILLADNSVYPCQGKIKFIDNSISTSTDTINIWAEFENPNQILNPGGIAKVKLTKPGSGEMPAIPASGVLHDKTGEFVYVVGKENILEKRKIELGTANGNTQCVEKGLAVGEIVVIGGTNKVMPGIPIRPVFEGEEDAFLKKLNAPAGAPQDAAAPQAEGAKSEGPQADESKAEKSKADEPQAAPGADESSDALELEDSAVPEETSAAPSAKDSRGAARSLSKNLRGKKGAVR